MGPTGSGHGDRQASQEAVAPTVGFVFGFRDEIRERNSLDLGFSVGINTKHHICLDVLPHGMYDLLWAPEQQTPKGVVEN